MKSKGLMALALASVLSVSALTPTAFAAAPASGTTTEATVQEAQASRRHGEKQSVATPENAIGKDAAKEKALADAGVTPEQAGKVKSRLSQLEDGTVVYKVSFTYDGQKYSYKIDAESGAVVETTTETVTEDTTMSTTGRGRRGRGQGGKTSSSVAETATAGTAI